MKAFNVYLNNKIIDTVFYSDTCKVDKQEVYKSLVEHDGYDPEIKVVKRRKNSNKCYCGCDAGKHPH